MSFKVSFSVVLFIKFLNPDLIPNPQLRSEPKVEIKMEVEDKESSAASDIMNEIESRLEAINSPHSPERIEEEVNEIF